MSLRIDGKRYLLILKEELKRTGKAVKKRKAFLYV